MTVPSGKIREVLRRNRDEAVIATTVFVAYMILHLVFQRHELMAYDLYTYTSFAEHYAENWFYTIIPEQAHGLEIVSYPPLLFQVMALLSFIPFLGQKWISIILMSGAVTALSFSFAGLLRYIMDLEQKSYLLIVVLVAFSPGLLKFSLVHGQLTFITGMIFGFMSTAVFYRIVRGEDMGSYLVASLVLTAYIHHFSLLMTVLLMLMVGLMNFRQAVSRINYLAPPIALSAMLALVGLYPVLRETLFGISQGVIFHGSRNPFETWKIFHQFVTSTYGVTVLGLLLVLKRDERLHAINNFALVFLTIGLGLVTPTAEMLFGGMSTFLVYDRFSLIASLFLTGIIGFYLSGRLEGLRDIDPAKVAVLLFIAISLVTVLWANDLHLASPTGYGVYDQERTQLAVDYLNQNASEDYLYMTYGHYPPVEEVMIETEVPTLDTGYFQGRKHGLLPGWGKFDRVPRRELSTIISEADRLSLKYIILYDWQASSILQREGWRGENLGEGVSVWVNPDAQKYEPDMGERRLVFGTVPLVMLFFCTSIFLSGTVRNRVESFLSVSRHQIRSTVGNRSRTWLMVIVLPLVAALPSFLTSGYPAGIDTPAHIFKPELMAQMVEQHGEIFRWTTQWYNGYPFMSMYPPVSTYMIYYLDGLLGDITAAFNIVRFIAISALSSVFYLLSGEITDRKYLRILASSLVVFSYPVYSNLYTVGRVASALALPLYLLLIYLVLRDDVFQKEISRSHIYIGLTAGSLFLVHTMMAYLFIFTGLIFCLIYRERITDIGLKPVIATFSIPLIISAPYIIRLVQHFSVTDPSWYVEPAPLNIFEHLKRFFDSAPPNYTGWLPVALFSLGLMKMRGRAEKFFTFSLVNFVFFYVAFWARNFGVAYFIPLSNQFDLARFEILFTVFGLLLAVYGARYLFEEYLEGIDHGRKSILALVMILFLCIEVSPMLMQSANWEPEFADELDEINIDEDYRAIGVDMRKWHTYILWELGVENTFGWFGQANPNQLFTESLQRNGGRWYGEPLRYVDNSRYMKNLLELSNTRYIVSAEGEWMDPAFKTQVKGSEKLNHAYNEQLIERIEEDSEFGIVHSSDYLSIYELQRSMDYCEAVDPVWISDDYRDRANQMFMQQEVIPRLPVRGVSQGLTGNASGIECSQQDPYTRHIEVEEPGWVLLKESYYPFWESDDGKKVYDGFGFMVVHVENSTNLEYQPRGLSTLSIDDFAKILG